MTTFDYIIIGAGSAGCVLANRLTEDADVTVGLIEAGGSDLSVFVHMPSALSIPMNTRRFNWGYETEPEPGLDGRVMNCPRGRGLGGSSSVNGMVYIRGHAMDFDHWVEMGARGWSYAEVLPYFRKAETRAEGGNEYRGSDGPLHTQYGPLKNPLYRAFIDAAKAAGYAETDDVNGYAQEGFGRMDMTVHKGRRWSTAVAYLRPAMKRPNLSVITHALTKRIVFEGRRAVGVAIDRGGVETILTARREVILSAGAIGSPHILKLSGIGPAAELSTHGIEVIADRPGVGENLQDHLEFYFQQACRQPISLFKHLSLLGKAKIGLEWILTQKGLGATNHFEACGFIRSAAGIPYPDIQYHFLPVAVRYDGASMADQHGFQAHVGPMRSKSRGTIRLKSADARDAPSIRFNYLTHEDDKHEMRACVRLTREIFQAAPFDPYRGEELSPGPDVQTDDEIDAFARAHVESAYHPSCAARMGDARDPMAVVDPHTRVIGVEGLRVVDSSIMPRITNGNLNAPTIMMAEKAADLIRGRTPLPPSNAPVYQHPHWQTAQR